VEVVDPGGRSEDIWLVELARGVMSRLFDPANDVYPVWSPDATRIMFASDRAGGNSTYTESDRTVRATTARVQVR